MRLWMIPVMRKVTYQPKQMTDEQKQLLGAVETDIAPIKDRLAVLSAKYRDCGEDRIAFEVLQSIRALDEVIYISGVYLRGTDGHLGGGSQNRKSSRRHLGQT
jgi:hypothetical protein